MRRGVNAEEGGDGGTGTFLGCPVRLSPSGLAGMMRAGGEGPAARGGGVTEGRFVCKGGTTLG